MAKSLSVENLLPQNVWSIINYCIIIIIIIIIKTESAVQGRERVRALNQSDDPIPHNQPMEERKMRKQQETKIKNRLGQQESIGSALKTLQSHTIKYSVTKIGPMRRREEDKGSAILRSFTAKGRLKGCIELLLILNSMHNTATGRRCYFRSTSRLSVYKLVLWGQGLRTDRVRRLI